MSEPTEIKNERVIRIGPDRVTIRDHEVIVEAKHEMIEWTVQAMNAADIYFEDKKYELTEKVEAGSPYAFRYVLRPWPEGKTQNARRFHIYNAEAVAEREGERRGEALNEIVWICLLPFYPFLGFFWARTQQRLHRFGFLPRTITGLSIFMSFGLLLAQGAFIALLLQASARSGTMMIGGMLRAMVGKNFVELGSLSVPVGAFDVLIALALMVDLAIRYSQYLREDQWTGGFLEWLVPRGLRKKQVDDQPS